MDWSKFNNLTILIIDDDQFTRELIRSMLKVVPNIIIHQARNGAEALILIENNKYDMLLLDLYMPIMGGKEFLRSLKDTGQLKESSVIVLITTDRLSTIEFQRIGASYCLTKPFDFHNFLKNVYWFLEQEIMLNEK